MEEKIFHDKYNGSQPNKKSNNSGADHHITLSDKAKMSNHSAKPLEEGAKPQYKNRINKPTYPLHVNVHKMNPC